jgi:hypothetical protein
VVLVLELGQVPEVCVSVEGRVLERPLQPIPGYAVAQRPDVTVIHDGVVPALADFPLTGLVVVHAVSLTAFLS